MIESDVQKLEPGDMFTCYEVNALEQGGGILRFHPYPTLGPIVWQGETYAPWAVKAEGFTLTTDRPPQPRLTVGNPDGTISVLCKFFGDLVGARVTRRRTLAKYLDAVNFPGGNPDADPDEHFADDLWHIDRKAVETPDAVEFELASAMDFNGVRLPRRQIIANQCPWRYRGPECNYTGPPVATADGTPTSDPALDRCGKRISDCKLRFGADNPLNFGGFPAAGLVRQ